MLQSGNTQPILQLSWYICTKYIASNIQHPLSNVSCSWRGEWSYRPSPRRRDKAIFRLECCLQSEIAAPKAAVKIQMLTPSCVNWRISNMAKCIKHILYRLPRLQWHRLQWHSIRPSGYSDTFLISQMAFLIVKHVWMQWHSVWPSGYNGSFCSFPRVSL